MDGRSAIQTKQKSKYIKWIKKSRNLTSITRWEEREIRRVVLLSHFASSVHCFLFWREVEVVKNGEGRESDVCLCLLQAGTDLQFVRMAVKYIIIIIIIILYNNKLILEEKEKKLKRRRKKKKQSKFSQIQAGGWSVNVHVDEDVEMVKVKVKVNVKATHQIPSNSSINSDSNSTLIASLMSNKRNPRLYSSILQRIIAV